MTRATYGMLMGMIVSAIGLWVWNRQYPPAPTASRGTVIFKNTPLASEGA